MLSCYVINICQSPGIRSAHTIGHLETQLHLMKCLWKDGRHWSTWKKQENSTHRAWNLNPQPEMCEAELQANAIAKE